MKKRILSGLVLIGLILSAIFFINNNQRYTDEQDYLSENNKIINLEEIEDFNGLEILDKDLENKKIILTGEEHGIDKDNLFSIKLLKYLHEKIGVNYYLAESGSTDAYFINKYLETGDESILKQVFDYNKGTPGDNIDDYNFFKQIYEFNKDIDDDSKIKIVGIDIEHSGISSYDYILDIIKDEKDATEVLNKLLNYLKVRDMKNIESSNQELIKDVEKNEDIYKDLFGENFEDFKYVLNNIQAMCTSYSTTTSESWNNVRDKYIYENFKYQDSKLDNAKYFGQWGGAHIYKETINYAGDNVDFVASLLNKDEEYKGKILSIQYGYYTEGEKYNMCPIDEVMFKEYLKTDDDAILFKLNSENSPFNNEFLYPIKYKPNPVDEAVTTDYFEYLLLIKNTELLKANN